MMPLENPYPYIVCYNLRQPIGSYQRFFAELKNSPRWWHYLDSTWIVLRHETLVELAPKLRPLIYTTDGLLIMPAKGPADGWLPKDAWTWISNNVPRLW